MNKISKKFYRQGFSLVEMIVAISIVVVLLLSLSTFLTNFLKLRSQAGEFIEVQDETYSLIQKIESLVKNANNAYVFNSKFSHTNKIFSNLLVRDQKYSQAPFINISPFEKSINAPKNSQKYLDPVHAANKGIDEEYYLSITDLYLYSETSAFDDQGKLVVYPDPASGTIKVMDLTKPKGEDASYASTVQNLQFTLPSGIIKKTCNSTTSNNCTFYVSDRFDHTVWEVEITKTTTVLQPGETGDPITTYSGTKTLFVGSPQQTGVKCNNDQNCQKCLLNQPNGLDYYNDTLYIADSKNHRLLKIDNNACTEIIKNTNYEAGKSDITGSNAENFQLNTPLDLVVTDEQIYFTDTYNHRVLAISNNDNKISLIAGTGTEGYSGEFGNSKLAKLSYPSGIVFNEHKNKPFKKELIFSDSGNNLIRKINLLQTEQKIYAYTGDIKFQIISGDYLTRVKTQRAHELINKLNNDLNPNNDFNILEISSLINQKHVSPQRPKESNYDLVDYGNNSYGLVNFNDAGFNFNTGLFILNNNLFITDSLNNKIKVFYLNIKNNAPILHPHFKETLFDLNSSEDLIGKVFPIISGNDYGNYNFTKQIISGETDYISPYPLNNMNFKLHGIKKKIVDCNLSIQSLSAEGLVSNNFQFSINIRNTIEN